MATSAVISIVNKIKKLSPDEQQELLTALESLFSPTPHLTEEEFHRRLAAEGRISIPLPKDRSRAAHHSFKPATVKGKPLSETIIEERR